MRGPTNTGREFQTLGASHGHRSLIWLNGNKVTPTRGCPCAALPPENLGRFPPAFFLYDEGEPKTVASSPIPGGPSLHDSTVSGSVPS